MSNRDAINTYMNAQQKREVIDAADEAGVPQAYLVRLCIKHSLSTVMELIRTVGLPPDPIADGSFLITKPHIPEVAPIVSSEPAPPIADFLSSGTFTAPDATCEDPSWPGEIPEEEELASEPHAMPEPVEQQRLRRRRSG